MSQDDRRRAILEAAGAEAAQRRPAQVIEMAALRSSWLANTGAQPAEEAKPEPTPPEPAVPEGVRIWPEWVQWPIRVSKYLGFACVVVAILMTFSWTRQTLILADVGRSTCSTLKIADEPEAQAFWTEEDAGSTVPKLKTRQFVACMKAGSPF